MKRSILLLMALLMILGLGSCKKEEETIKIGAILAVPITAVIRIATGA